MYKINKEIKLSIIIPVYNEQDNIEELYLRLVKVLENLERSYEIIFVDDGSTDKSFIILNDIYNKNGTVKIVRLTKNFGQAAALLAGFSLAQGQTIVTMDADLQYAPEDIPKLLKKIDEGFKIVCGWRRKRRDSLFLRKLPSYFANIFARIKIKENTKDLGCTFIALNRSIATQLKNYGNMNRFFKPLLIKLADSIYELKVEHYPRKTSRSQYDIIRLIKIALDFIINFSFKATDKKSSFFVIEKIIE